MPLMWGRALQQIIIERNGKHQKKQTMHICMNMCRILLKQWRVTFMKSMHVSIVIKKITDLILMPFSNDKIKI